MVDITNASQNAHGSLLSITVTNFFAAIPVAVGVVAALTVTSPSASALTVGLTGATNPAFQVDASTALQVAGLKLTGAVTGGTVALVAIDSGSNTNLTINAKGSGTIGIGTVSTGLITLGAATAVSSVGSSALAVGPSGATNPILRVDASTGSAVAGLTITGAVTGGTVAIVARDSGADTSLTLNAKGAGTIGIGTVSTGAVTITPATTITGALSLAGTVKLTGTNQQIWGATTSTQFYTHDGSTAVNLGIYDTGIVYFRGVGYTGGAAAGEWVIANNVHGRAVNAAGNANIALIGTNSSNQVVLDNGGAGVKVGGDPSVFIGGATNGIAFKDTAGVVNFQVYNSGIAFLRGVTTTTAAAAGDLILANASSIRSVNAAGTTTHVLVQEDASAVVRLGGGALLVGAMYQIVGNFPAGAAGNNGGFGIENTNNRFVFYSGGNRYWVAGTAF